MVFVEGFHEDSVAKYDQLVNNEGSGIIRGMKSHELYTFEKPDKINPDHIERKFERVHTETSENMDKNSELKRAQEHLLHNPKLYEKFLRATLDKDIHKNRTGLVRIENIFVAELQNLTDTEIDSVVRQFNQGFKQFVSEYTGTLELTSEQRRKIFENDQKNNKEIRGNIHENSIKNVIEFIRARKKLLDVHPAQEYAFYTQETLDEHFAIDLIECIYAENGDVDVMNLVQIKSSLPTAEDQQKIVQDHKEWVTSSAMDLDMWEKEYSNGIPEKLKITELVQNAEAVSDVLFDMCTDPKGFQSDKFIEALDFSTLSNKHRAWLLIKYGGMLKSKIQEAVTQQIIQPEQADEILKALEKFEEEIKQKAKIPKNFSRIHEINSIIAVGAKEIQKINIMSRDTDERHKKLAKVTQN